ncbi:MAG: ankyrin repeat domain-containing protein [Oscillospiraceae bacterium]|nr:ankyrin repeat domain-containing protein [Oscillospiraceae bacterium]
MNGKKIFKIILITIAAILVTRMALVPYERIQCNRMIDAIRGNDIEKLERVLKVSNPNCVSDALIPTAISESGRYTPLGEACKVGNFEMVKLLVENGADVNYAPLLTETLPLGFAAESESIDNLKIVKYLIEKGADVDFSKYKHGHPGFRVLSTGGEDLRPNGMEILEALLEAGTDPNKERLLQVACVQKHEEVIRYLVEEWGYDASDPANLCGYCYGVSEYSYETFEYFLERGANPYEKYLANEFKGEKCAIEYLQEESPEWAEKLIDLAASYGITE